MQKTITPNVKRSVGTVLPLLGEDSYKYTREFYCFEKATEEDMLRVAGAIDRYLNGTHVGNITEAKRGDSLEIRNKAIEFAQVWDDYRVKYKIAMDDRSESVKVSVLIDKRVYDGRKGHYVVSDEERDAMLGKMDEYANDLKYVLNQNQL